MPGLESIPLRIPDRWDPVWFESFVREVLALADARNAQPGPGISISGQPNEPAVISGSADVDVIADADFVLAVPNGELANGRVLTGEPGVVNIEDQGPGNQIRVAIADHSIVYSKIQRMPECSVLGRAENSWGATDAVRASDNDRLLARVSDVLAFVQLTAGMVPDGLLTYEKLQDVSATARVLGRKSAGSGPVEELTLTELLDLVGSAADGDMLVRVDGEWTRLPAGSDGEGLMMVNGVPTWVTPPCAPADATFVTVDDETANLPNSRRLVAGSNITFDTSTPGQLTIHATGSGGGGAVNAVIGGTGISVDNTDPTEPVVSLSADSQAALALATTAVQPGDLANVAFSGEYSDLSGIPSTFAPSAHTHNASDINAGTLADERLSSNIPRLNATNTFSAVQTVQVSGATPLSIRRVGNSQNVNIEFRHDGATRYLGIDAFGNLRFGETANLSGSGVRVSLEGHTHSGEAITSGTIADARLSSNVPRKDAPNVFTRSGAGLGSAAIAIAANAPNFLMHETDQDANGGLWVFSLAAGQFRLGAVPDDYSGAIPASSLLLSATRSGAQITSATIRGGAEIELNADLLDFNGDADISGSLTVGGTISGNGSGLTNLNASNLSSGTVPDARLSPNVMLTGAYGLGSQNLG